MSRTSGNRTTEAGISSALEFAMVFNQWAGAQATLKAEAIVARFQCSRATGYRYLNAYRAMQARRQAARP